MRTHCHIQHEATSHFNRRLDIRQIVLARRLVITDQLSKFILFVWIVKGRTGFGGQ